MSRSDVEGRVPGLGSRSCDLHSSYVGDLLRIAFLNRDRVSINRGSIDAAARGADIKRDAMGSGHKRQVVSADLVGNVAIGSNTITAHHHGVDLTPPHQQSAGTVDDHGAGHPKTAQLPGRKGRSLQAGTRFIQPGMAQQATGMGGCNHTEGGTNASRSDGTRVAMVQDPAPLSQQGNAMIHQPLGQKTILLLKRSGHTDERFNICLLYTSPSPRD